MDDDSDGGERSADTMRQRVPGNSVVFWFVLAADRWLVTAAFLGAVLCGLVALGVLHPTPARTLLTRGDPLETLFQALVGATVTGVTLVLTLNQVVLSQEQGPVGDQRERMEGALSFRRDVEDIIDEPVGPAQPSAFLRSLVALTDRRAAAVQTAVQGIDSERLAAQVERFVPDLQDNARRVARGLDGAQFGEFDVLLSALNYNYSRKLYLARRVRVENEDALTEEARAAFDDLLEALELFGPAREHFKTLYFQWELTSLSRTILFAALPALVVAIGSLLFLDPQDVTTTTLGVSDALYLTAGAVTVTLLPFAVLLAYVLRIATVTKRTLSIGPFILRETGRSHDIDWDADEDEG